MKDKVQSEQSRFQSAQIVGSDNYEDRTGTSYGGLQHTSPIMGAFKTQDNTLLLTANNEEGISFSTFDTAMWNGMTSGGYPVSQRQPLVAGLPAIRRQTPPLRALGRGR